MLPESNTRRPRASDSILEGPRRGSSGKSRGIRVDPIAATSGRGFAFCRGIDSSGKMEVVRKSQGGLDMVLQPVTIELPPTMLETVRQRARHSQRSVQEELVELVSSKLADDASAESIDEALEGLGTLSDQELLQTAALAFPSDVSEQTAELNEKLQRQGLADGERKELKAMLDQYDRHVLVRAKALSLLKVRGHDISPLLVPPVGA